MGLSQVEVDGKLQYRKLLLKSLGFNNFFMGF